MKAVSNILLEARKKQGTGIIELSKKLNISIFNLTAIESGDFSKMPGDPYTLGFIKTYADYFNLDTDLIVKIYKDETIAVEKKDNLIMPLYTNNSHYYYLKFGFASFVIIGFFAFFYNFFYLQTNIDDIYAITPKLEAEMIALVEEEEFKQSLKKLKEFKEQQKIANLFIINDLEDEDKTNIEESISENNLTNTGIAIAGISKEKITNIKNEIILKMIDDTWVHIKGSDDNIIISKLMKKNEKFILNSYSYYFITTGNAGNIEILIKNKRVGKLGRKGEVLNSFKLSSNFINN